MSEKSQKRVFVMYFGLLFMLVVSPIVGGLIKTGEMGSLTELGTYLNPEFVAYLSIGVLISIVAYFFVVLITWFLILLLFPVMVFLKKVWGKIRIAFGLRK